MDRMDGKVVLLTGATSGIGRIAAEALAAGGAKLVLVGRDRSKLDAVCAETGAEGILADLSAQADVRRVAAELRHARLDVLINNAGALFTERGVTVDGIERTFALNHLAYFLLTNLLLDRLRAAAPSRIVNVASGAHRRGAMHWDDLQLTRYGGQGWTAYQQSKLANILFTRELARRLEGTGVTTNCLHPGFVDTGFGRNNGPLARLLFTLTRPIQRTPEQGADTLVWAASDPGLSEVSGRYFQDRAERTPARQARRDDDARRLWDISARMVGV
jgi:NAD(P)-dependent dehydrogenase (short-subunit alcohol dehydrogenase family)